MPNSLQELRRAFTEQSIRKVIQATASFPIGLQRFAMNRATALAAAIPMLRRRVGDNMRLALGDNIPARSEHQYFRNVGWLYASQLAIFHRGFSATPVTDEIGFDDTISVLDDAIAQGRGVVLCSPHYVGHELMAGVIARRHPLVMLVRQAPTAERAARKTKWYGALGVDVLWRPQQASTVKDALAYLQIFKTGKILFITPDLLADPLEGGIDVSIFGRQGRLKNGAFFLAVAAKVPMIRLSVTRRSDRAVALSFERAPRAEGEDREAAIQSCAQDWCRWFENGLRANPENWLFWLDKRWSRFLRETPRTGT